jgi:threonine dehydrogenase-like Zn-dependent dehydrogenase
MRSMVYAGVGDLREEESSQPTVGPRDVLLRVEACGICGSDVASYLHGHYVEPGQVLGHEISAVVADMGQEISGLRVGGRVAVRPSRSCGHCTYCAADKPYLCAQSRQRTLGYGERGGFADLVLLEGASVGADLLPVPDELPAEEVLWAEPLAVAVHAVRRSHPAPDKRLLVVGAGSVGLCVIAAARAAGTREVWAVEPRPERRAAAEGLGAHAVEPGGFPGRSIDSIIDASGSANAVRSAVGSLVPGGDLVLVGLGDQPVPWPMPTVDVVASFAYTDEDFRLAVDHLVSGRVSLRRFVDLRVDLPATGAAIAASASDPAVTKAAVFPAPE